ncbi:MAG: hypothetical protein FWE24_10360 [Defluviitaleaceae bacterium]|nr:hypothetical protein [Defluviitaleaceae bacterium]
MNFANCRGCKKPFVKISSLYCEACLKAEEELFKSVRDYLYEHPGSDINKVAAATGIPVRKIFDYIRDGRIGLS